MKKLLSLTCTALCLCSILACPLAAHAAELPAESTAVEMSIQPRWVNVAAMSGNIEPGILGTYKAHGAAVSERSTDKLTVTCTIQKFTASGWSNTSTTWSNTGTGVCEASKSLISLAAGDYRVKVVATVYDAAGNYVETATYYTSSVLVS